MTDGSEKSATEAPRAGARWRPYLLLVAVCAVVCLLLKLPFWTADHLEPDEAVYWTLAQRLTWGEYDVQGSAVLRGGYISPAIYDRPLFHHPPLYPALLNPFTRLGAANETARRAAVTVSWLGHLLALAAVAWAGWTLMAARGLGWRAPAIWLSLAGVTLDPHLLFDSRSLWMDPLLGGLVALSMAAIVTTGAGAGWRRWALAGALLGLAANTKLTALAALPLGAAMIAAPNFAGKFQKTNPKSQAGAQGNVNEDKAGGASGWLAAVGIYAGTALAMVVPWLAVFWAEYGTLTPSWIRGDTWTIERQPYVAWVMSRPWWEYAARLTWMTPVVWWALGLGAWGWTRRMRTRGADGAERVWAQAALWVVGLGVIMTWLGTSTTGFQMRYLSPMIPGMYVMLGAALAGMEENSMRRWAWVVAAVLVAYGAANLTMNYRFPDMPVLIGVFETGRLGR